MITPREPIRSVLVLMAAHCCITLLVAFAAGAEHVKPDFPGDVTSFCFFAWSGTHFDGRSQNGLRDDAVNDMNRLRGRAMPAGYGLINPVAFVLHAGDVTANARANMFKNDDGRTEDDFISCIGRLGYPVFEVRGNHDADGGRTCVTEGIWQRHGALSYSFDCGGVHFLCMDMARGPIGQGSPELQWLAGDLDNVGPNRPVILLQHRAPATDNRWKPFHDVIARYNIVLICHGDSHRHRRYVWHGIDVWDVGHVDGRAVAWSADPRTISVFRIEGSCLKAAHYLTAENRWDTTYMLDKAISRQGPPDDSSSRETAKPK